MRSIKNPWLGIEGYNCFGCCPSNPYGVKMQFYEDGQDIVCFWKPQEQYQSWVNTLHGGVQAVLLDEICGWVVSHHLRKSGVTAKPVVIDQDYVELRARLREMKRNIAIVDGEIKSAEGEVLVECTCTYFTFDAANAPTEVPYRPTEVGEEITREEVLASLRM